MIAHLLLAAALALIWGSLLAALWPPRRRRELRHYQQVYQRWLRQGR